MVRDEDRTKGDAGVSDQQSRYMHEQGIDLATVVACLIARRESGLTRSNTPGFPAGCEQIQEVLKPGCILKKDVY
jgi:hypothetical protein